LIGIDIIDHSDPLLRKRDERSFRLIRHPLDIHPDTEISEEALFWHYWVAKEAVYKAKRALIRFDPKQIEIQLQLINDAWCFNSGSIHGSLIQNQRYTYGICAESTLTLDALNHEIFESTSKDQSAAIRALMIQSLKKQQKSDIRMNMDKNGLPMIEYDNQNHLATFTHHHHLMAYICL
jgi:phosphopantetheinyl transferase (holo-ACP synthase)